MNATTAALNDLSQTAAPPVNDGGGSAAKVPETFFVLDTTAKHGTGQDQKDRSAGLGPRIHDMIVVDGKQKFIKSWTFEPGKPQELPIEIAIKFLRNPGFMRTDKDGNPLPYNRQPKQPEELGPGEQFKLEDHQTVADYGELTTMSLMQRVLEQPGGEALRDKRDREGMIDFIIRSKAAKQKANLEKRAGSRGPAVAAVDEEEIIVASEDDE